jgi:Zn-dependent protease
MTFLLVLLGWVFSLCLHEFSHAAVAYAGGDTTVREKGYLTFNPLKYTHPVYSIVVPLIFLALGGIGLPGGAVYIETWRLRSRWWKSAVSLAGPMSNLVLAIALGVILAVSPVSREGLWPGLAFLAFLQVSALVLNLIPLPPFDGFGVLQPFLPEGIQKAVAQVSGLIPWAVFFLLWYVPEVYNTFWAAVVGLTDMLNVPLDLVQLGLRDFRFWYR